MVNCQTSVDNGYIVMMRMTRLTNEMNDHDEMTKMTNEEKSRWKRRRWWTKISWSIHQRSWMKYSHDVFHVKGEKKTCFKRYNHRQENVRTKKNDYKYQGEFTRHWRQNSRDHMKKYSQRGDRMDVKSRTRKESFERKPQRDFADKTYDYSIDWRKANLTKMVVLNEIWNKHVWNLVNDCVL